MVTAGANGSAELGIGTDTSPVVSVRDLDVMFRRGGHDLHAVRGVSFDVMPGEIVGVVGESGSGKSVLGLSLLGLLPRDPAPKVSGSAFVCGVDMVSASAEERRLVRKHHLGAVFQDPMTSLNPTMRVGKQVVEAAGSKAEAHDAPRRGRHPRAGAPVHAVPARAVGRPAATGDDRARDRRESAARRRRRTDDGARRHRAGADPRAVARARERAALRVRVRHPRPRCRVAARGPHRGDVRRAARRVRRRPTRCSPAPRIRTPSGCSSRD